MSDVDCMAVIRRDEAILHAVDAYVVAILDHEDAIGKRAAVWRLIEGSVSAEQHRGAVEVAAQLRVLGDEWRSEWPDGRVCKAELHRLADLLDGGQS